MAEKMVLRKLLTALVFEREGKRIDMAPGMVAQFTPDEVKRINGMNAELLEYPSDDEVELFNLRQAKATALVDAGATDLEDGPAAAPAAAATKKPAAKKPAAKPADPATAAEGPAAAATGTEDGKQDDEI